MCICGITVKYKSYTHTNMYVYTHTTEGELQSGSGHTLITRSSSKRAAAKNTKPVVDNVDNKISCTSELCRTFILAHCAFFGIIVFITLLCTHTQIPSPTFVDAHSLLGVQRELGALHTFLNTLNQSTKLSVINVQVCTDELSSCTLHVCAFVVLL